MKYGIVERILMYINLFIVRKKIIRDATYFIRK